MQSVIFVGTLEFQTVCRKKFIIVLAVILMQFLNSWNEEWIQCKLHLEISEDEKLKVKMKCVYKDDKTEFICSLPWLRSVDHLISPLVQSKVSDHHPNILNHSVLHSQPCHNIYQINFQSLIPEDKVLKVD